MRLAFELRDNVTAREAVKVALAGRLDRSLFTAIRLLAASPDIRCAVEVLPALSLARRFGGGGGTEPATPPAARVRLGSDRGQFWPLRQGVTITSIVDAWVILGDQRARAEYDAAQQPGIPEQVVAVAAEPVTLHGQRFSRQIRRTFIAAIIVVTLMMLVLFVVGMSQSGG